MAGVDLPIRLVTTGGKQSADEIGRLEAAIAASRAELDAFKRGGGLGAVAVGRREIDLASKDITVLGNEARATQARIAALNAELADSGRSRPLQVVINDLEQAERAAADLENRISRVGTELRESTAQSVGFLGDIDSSFQALGGTSRTLGEVTGIQGFGQVGEALTVAGDLFAAAEALPRLSSAFNELQSRLGAAAQAARAASAAQAIENTADLTSVGTTTASTTAEGGLTAARLASAKATAVAVASSLAIPAAIGGVVLAYRQLQIAQEQAAAPVDAYIDSFDNLKQSQAEGVDLTQLSVAELRELQAAERERLRQIEEATQKTRQLNEESQQALDDFTIGDFAELLPAVGGIIEALGIADLIDSAVELSDKVGTANPITGPVALIGDAFDFLVDQVSGDAGGSILGAITEFAELGNEARATTEAIDEQIQVTVRQEREERALIAARREEERVIREQARSLDNLTRERDAAQNRIEGLREEQSEARARRAETIAARERQAVLQRSQDERRNALLAQIERAEQVEAERQARQEIINIQNEARQKETEIQRRIAQEQVQARAALDNEIAEINRDFQQEQIKATQEFQKEELRRREDFNRERLRLVQDLDQSLLDAARDNDVNAFIAAQERGLTALARADEDESIETRRRGEDFADARRGAASDREQRIAELRAEFAAQAQERQRAAQQEIQNIRQQAQERAAAIRQGTEQTLTEVDKLQQQLAALEKTFIQEREQFRLDEEARAFNNRQRLNAQRIQQESQALQRYNAEIMSVGSVLGRNAAISVLNGINQQLNQPVAAITSSLGGLFGQRSTTVVNRQRIQMTNVIGDVATTQTVEDGVRRGLRTVAQAFTQ